MPGPHPGSGCAEQQTVTELPAIVVGIALANEFVLVRFPAPVPARVAAAGRITLAVTLSLVMAALLSWFLLHHVLAPFGAAELALVSVVFAAALAAPLTITLLERSARARHSHFQRPELALIGIDCGMLAVVLLLAGKLDTAPHALLWATGIGVVFSGISTLFASLRPRLDASEVPAPLRGVALALVTGAFLTLALGELFAVLPD